MQPDILLSYLERAGSFGLIVGIVIYAIRYAIPAGMAELKEQRNEFLAALGVMEKQRAEEHVQTMQALTTMATEIKGLADKTAEHRALLDDCPHRSPLPLQKP